jgi:hypothetical protein
LQYSGKLARSAVEKRSAANVPLDGAVVGDRFDRSPKFLAERGPYSVACFGLRNG